MDGERDEWLTPQAGIPLYPAIFGRDAVTAGWQAAMLDRAESLDATLTFLGRRQSARHDDWRDEEPGRTPHSLRRGPLGTLNLNPYAAYYGDMAGPLMYVIGLAHLYSWTGDAGMLRRHWDTARRILDWARTDGDKDRDGYLEYQSRSAKGAKNQGWKDSGDAVVYDDGSNVPAPIASCELQGYWFAAQQLMAVMSVAMGDVSDARRYWRDAAALKTRFNRDWWLEAEGSVALALDPDKQVIRAATSNIGHCLACGIISAEHVPPLVGRLFAPDMFSGWGVRTLSSQHRFYDPLSYHRGSVWPVEQATIAFGLRRFGFARRANELTEATFDLATHYPGYRLPECIGGYSRGAHAAPGAYPRANPLQLWNAAAVPLFIHSMLGLQPVAPLELLVVDPHLPAWLPEIVLTDVRLAGATVTLRFWRDSRGASHAKVVRKRGTFRLIKQPPPESLEDGARDRMAALFDTLVH
jgi:glycogen debranching enzyme